jgi:quercetin dioxygenase-like cupin family protein
MSVKCSPAAKKEINPLPHLCPKNYKESSKGMESTGLKSCVLCLHNKHKLMVETFVIDDDATTKAHIHHSFQELITSGRMLPAKQA